MTYGNVKVAWLGLNAICLEVGLDSQSNVSPTTSHLLPAFTQYPQPVISASGDKVH